MEVKGQKITQNEKLQLHLLRVISQEQYSIWSWFLVHLCKMMISPGVFHFFKILIFWVVSGVKEQKIAQNDKNFCVLHFISQESYIMWLSFMVHLYEMMISLGVFFIFSKLWFFRLLGGSKEKKWPKITKNYVCCALYLRNDTSYDLALCCTCVVGWYLQVPNFYFWGQ